MLFNEAKNNLDFSNCYKVGKIFKPHANKGKISASLLIALNELKLESIFVEINKNLIPFFIDYSNSSINDTSAILKLKNVDFYRAKIFKNNNIYIPKNKLSKIKEYITDFENFVIGYELFDSKKNKIGEILDFIEDNNNPIFVVEYKNSDVFLPIFSIEIINTDFTNRKIIAEIPQSLLDL